MNAKNAFRRLCTAMIVACLFCTAFVSIACAESEKSTVRVMTRNMDAGTDFNYVLAAKTEEDFEAALGLTIEEVANSKIPERAFLLAAEIKATKPDLVALQEVTTWEFESESGTIVLDQLDLLLTALHAQGQHYRVAVLQTLTAIPVPGASFVDHNAILVRAGLPPGHLDVIGTKTKLFDIPVELPLPGGGTVPFLSGWAAVDVKIRGARFAFATTHLESAIPPEVQLMQAEQLLGDLQETRFPVILAGDFNSDAEPPHDNSGDITPSAGYITDSGYVDVWRALHRNPNNHGYTWPLFGEDQQSGNPVVPMERIDLIFSRGPVPTGIELTGTHPDRNNVFASDHVGVVADFHLENHCPDRPKDK